MLTDFRMTASGSAVLPPRTIEPGPSEPKPEPAPSGATKFDAAFLDRRMAEHRAWCEQMRPYPRAVPEEEDRFCIKCQSTQRFVFDRECALGVLGICTGCGDEYLRHFTRTTSEVA